MRGFPIRQASLTPDIAASRSVNRRPLVEMDDAVRNTVNYTICSFGRQIIAHHNRRLMLGK